MENTRFLLSFLPADNQSKGLFLLFSYELHDFSICIIWLIHKSKCLKALARREGLRQGANRVPQVQQAQQVQQVAQQLQVPQVQPAPAAPQAPQLPQAMQAPQAPVAP